MKAFWPRSLAGQIILSVALALLLAQAINSALILRERDRQQVTLVAAPAAARIIDAVERQDDAPSGRHFHMRSRVDFGLRDPILAGAPLREDIAQRAEALLAQGGLSPVAVRAAETKAPPPSRRRQRYARAHGHDIERDRTGILVAAELAPGQWASITVGLPRPQRGLPGWLLGQTLILYIVILVPLLLLGRRLARPLRDLTASTHQFAQTGSAPPVTERGPDDVRELARGFNQMRARIDAMLTEKDRMLGAIGHDLRTPLASLRVRTESVEDEGERSRMAATIAEMERTLDDILALARLGRSMEPAQPVDVSALVDVVVEDFIDLGKDVSMAEAGRVVVSVRPTLLRRALRNLIENALKYGERARVSLHVEPERLRIDVEDDGPGIAPERMAEMMEPFTRLEASRNRDTGGAGLGLALARSIAAEHGGELRLSNRPDGGLRASLSIART